MENRKLLLGGKIYDCRPEETVLEALLRQKVEVPHVCQRQVCLSCMMRSLGGPPPAHAQTNLKDAFKLQHLFLACGCFPERDMEIALAEEAITVQATAEVAELNPLNPHVLELVLRCDPPLHYRGGQSMTLFNGENIGKGFPVASPSSARLSGRIELHVERIRGAFFSEWIHDSLRVGDVLTACGATGELFYGMGHPNRPLLMAGWNGGLGALIGVMQDAFENDHSGPVYLFHGASRDDHLYFVDELREIGEQFPNFHYIPCVEHGAAPDGIARGTVHSLAAQLLPNDLSGWTVFLCGARNEVHALQRQVYLAGAAMNDMHIEVMSI
jgi:ferredoxin-NADP reductase/ferredoxin